jgi:hypothetical protein
MIPALASLCESRRVTTAVTGPLTLVVQLSGRNLSILHGELMGLSENLDQLETSWDALQNTARSYGFKWLAAHR